MIFRFCENRDGTCVFLLDGWERLRRPCPLHGIWLASRGNALRRARNRLKS